MTDFACLVAGAFNPRPPGLPADPGRPSHQAGQAPHAWGGRKHVRPTCTLGGTSYVCAHTVQSHVLGNATLELASGFLKLSGGCGRASQPACFLNQLRKCACCQRYAEIKEMCLPACRILSRAACAARNKSIVTCNGESCDS